VVRAIVVAVRTFSFRRPTRIPEARVVARRQWHSLELGIAEYRTQPSLRFEPRPACAAAMQPRGASEGEGKGTGIYDERL
jgi:hypothetical protein